MQRWLKLRKFLRVAEAQASRTIARNIGQHGVGACAFCIVLHSNGVHLAKENV